MPVVCENKCIMCGCVYVWVRGEIEQREGETGRESKRLGGGHISSHQLLDLFS